MRANDVSMRVTRRGPVSRPGPPAGVAEALEALSRAFASRDVEAALACFADDDSVVYSGSEVGEVAAGRNELRSLFAALFERELAYSWDVTELWSSSRGDLAFVTAEAVGLRTTPRRPKTSPTG